jgi:hypothetical protein
MDCPSVDCPSEHCLSVDCPYCTGGTGICLGFGAMGICCYQRAPQDQYGQNMARVCNFFHRYFIELASAPIKGRRWV